MLHALQLDCAKPRALAIGKFDGVHLGHQALIAALCDAAKKCSGRSAVIIFEPHPEIFFNRDCMQQRLMTVREKVFWLKHYGIDDIYIAPFNADFAQLSPEQFFNSVVHRLNVCCWIAGEDMHFGVKRSGNFQLLQELADSQHIVVQCIIPRCMNGVRVGSTVIRNMLQMGQVEQALSYLGHDYTLSGRVRHGAQQGRTLGFPTANIPIFDPKPPLQGVYTVCVSSDTFQNYPAVMNIGFQPTVSGQQFCLEVHLLNFSGDLYGKRLRVHILKKLRDERKFESLDALKTQITQDVREAWK